jgi:predicted transcriptional regulator
MACPAQDITDTELAILRLLWERGSLTTREVAGALYSRSSSSAGATVQSLLARLEAKGMVRREKGGRPRRFAARIDRDELVGRRLRSLADKLCDGALSPLLSGLVRGTKLSAKERAELRALLEELER